MDQADLTSLATAKMPASESYGLVNQTRRASVAANIAEGYALRNRAAYLGHLQIAAGSQAELESETEIARRRFLGSDSSVQKLSDVSGRVGATLNALIRALQASPFDRPPSTAMRSRGAGAQCRAGAQHSAVPLTA
ncbi:MAG: four helix bundle protein [Vicinamibacteraceae bacterium]|nr:four helix bundle protein [Vicinamibacteraceae bacterium]